MARTHIRARLARAACVALAIPLVSASVGGRALAQDGPSAVVLFEKGRKLMERRDTLDEACKTLEESLKLADRGDTLLNLAECHRRQGRSATAWAEFDRALGVGTKVGFTEAIRAATRFRDYLAARLSRLTVTVSPETAALPEFTLLVNGKPLPPQVWNTAVPRDPGSIEVTATAKGYKPFVANIGLAPENDARTVVVTLELLPPPPPPPPVVVAPPPPPPPVVVQTRAARPIWPWIVGAAGVALGAVAIGFEVDSRSAGSTLNSACSSTRTQCPVGYDFGPTRDRELRGYDLFVGLGVASIVALGAAGVGLGYAYRPSADRAGGDPQTPASGDHAQKSSTGGVLRSASFLFGPTSVAVRSSF